MIKLPELPGKVLVCGDWHGNRSWAEMVLLSAFMRGITTVVHVGDFGFWTPGEWTERYLDGLQTVLEAFGIILLWVDGNHECFPELYRIPINPVTGLREIRPNIAHIPRGHRWTWAGKTWMGLGGARSVDRYMRKSGVSWWLEEELTEDDVTTATLGGHVDVMITHDCPSETDIPLPNSAMFPPEEIAAAEIHRGLLGKVVDEVTPELLIHGHYHVNYRARRGPTTIIGLSEDGTSISDNTIIVDPETLGLQKLFDLPAV